MATNKLTQIFKEVNPNRIQYSTVKGIFTEGAQNRYKRNLQRWQLNHSTEIKIDGFIVGENDHYNSSEAKKIETNNTDINGIPLNEITFIKIELKKSIPILEKSEGSSLNSDVYEETKLYIEYLEERKTILEEKKSNPEITDYSDSSQIEKFVMLHELGIIDFLKNKLSIEVSESILGKLISSFTGIHPKTSIRYINSIKNAKDKNNPLKVDNINSINAKLTKLGLSDFIKK